VRKLCKKNSFVRHVAIDRRTIGACVRITFPPENMVSVEAEATVSRLGTGMDTIRTYLPQHSKLQSCKQIPLAPRLQVGRRSHRYTNENMGSDLNMTNIAL